MTKPTNWHKFLKEKSTVIIFTKEKNKIKEYKQRERLITYYKALSNYKKYNNLKSIDIVKR